MAAIRSSGNKSTEKELIRWFRKEKIKGWTRRNTGVKGRPDFLLRKDKIAIFADGCFWHGCSRCNLMPSSNKSFWQQKISGNKARDRRVNKNLKKEGWKVVRIWEHEIKKGNINLRGRIYN